MDFMMPIVRNAALALLLSSASVLSASAQTPLPDAIAAPGETVVLTLHAEGAQIYECKAGADGKLAWAFREPTAALLLDGKTVGRHYTGPNWEHIDSSAVVGKAVGNAPGATANDIPWLKLTVTSGRPRMRTLWYHASFPHDPSYHTRFELKIPCNGQNQSQS